MAKKRFCDFLIKFRWLFIILFAVLTIASCVMIFYTDVLYDLSAYLPADSDANIGIGVLKEEFDDKGMAYVAVKNVSREEANELADKISGIEGVSSVVYVEMQNYVDGNAMYTLSFDDYDSTKGCFDTMKRVTEYMKEEGYEAYYTGQSASSYFTKLETEESILKLGLVIVAVILVMLVFTSKTYFELIPMVITFGVAVALNIGTNIFFNFAGGISYISNLVSLVLQLALSIDYSVILLHRFMEETALTADVKTAASDALGKGITEICSSSLTTIAGLVSLVFMALPIGREIGIALAKSIVCSLASVIFLMPALLTVFARPLVKTAHKTFVPDVKKFFGKVVTARKVIVPLFIVVVALAGTGQFFNEYAYNMNGGSMIIKNNEAIEEMGFGKINSLVLIVPKGDYAKERELARFVSSHTESVDGCNALAYIELADGIYLTDQFGEEELINLLKSGMGNLGSSFEQPARECFHKALAQKYPEGGVNELSLLEILTFVAADEEYSDMVAPFKSMLEQLEYAKSNLEGENYARLTFNISSGVESEETFKLIKDVKEGVGDFYDEFYITGESVVCYDMAEYFPKDNLVVSLVTVFAVMAILLFTFKNLLLPVILILAIQGGIWMNFVIPFLTGGSLSFIGYLIINAVQMGATIDYAIVLTNRYNTIKNNFHSPSDAMAEAQNLVFPTIITSGIILTITGLALALLSSGVVAKLGSLLAIGTSLSMFIVLFVLPSMLLLSEKAYDKCYFKDIFKFGKKRKSDVVPAVAATEENSDESDE